MNASIENSVEYKRQAIFTCLKSYLEYDDLMEALCLWQKEYSDEPKFAISEFVSHLINRYHLENKRRELQGKMIRIMMASAESLDPDPLPLLHAYQKKHGVSCEAHVDTDSRHKAEAVESKLFRLFVNELEVLLRSRDNKLVKQINNTFILQMSRFDMQLSETKQLEEWLQKRLGQAPVELNKDKLHELINAVYVELCDRVGPVESDSIFGRAINTVEQLEEAGGQSPRILL